MKTECSFADGITAETYNRFTDGLEEKIAGEHKCAVIGVFDGEPSFSYSIGLTDHGWPEVVIAGVDVRIGCGIINNVVDRFESTGVPEPLVELNQIARGFPVRLEPISEAQLEQYMCQAIERQERVGGKRPTGMQIVFPDLHGRWPDDPECDALTVRSQALLTDDQKERLQ